MLSVAHEVGYSLRHPFDEHVRLQGRGLHHLIDSFLAKHLILGFLSLIESVGIEEECAAWGEISLLGFELTIKHGPYGKIAVDRKRLPVDKRCFMSCITIAQMPSIEVEHPGEEGDEDSHATVITNAAGTPFPATSPMQK